MIMIVNFGLILRPTKQRLLVVGNSHSKDIFNVLYNSKTASKRYQLARLWCANKGFR